MATVQNRRAPLYQRVAKELNDRIAAEVYPVGSTLPTEIEICREFGISRHTVREALRMLSTAGLISRRQKAGTRVIARTPPAHFAENLSSVDDILRYSNRTRAKLLNRSEHVADEITAALLECEEGQAWLLLESVRRDQETDQPISHTQTYLNMVLKPFEDRIAASETSRFAVVEDVLGITIEKVRQDTSACAVPASVARFLDVRNGTPGLRIVRHYYDSAERLLMASINIHPAEKFSMTIEMHRTESALPRPMAG